MSDRFNTMLIGAAALAFLVPLSSVALAAPADQTPYSHALGDLSLAKTALRHQAGDPPPRPRKPPPSRKSTRRSAN